MGDLTQSERDLAADAIRRAIVLIDWSGIEDPALNNAWASLNTALYFLGKEPLPDEAAVTAYREGPYIKGAA